MKFRQLRALVARNCKIFFRDKGVFFPSLLAPLILLFLFIAFLGNVYRDSIRSVVAGFPIPNGLVESIAGGWLVSSLIAVSAVAIAFTAATVMVQDRALGRADDFAVAPVSPGILALAYFLSTFLVTALICFVALAAGFVYLAVVGWHLSVWDVAASLLDTLLLVLFGTALASLVCNFVHSQGGVTAIEATVSAAYGFLCGAYMPFGNLAPWLRDVLMLLPGSYGTGLLHLHLMGGAIDAVTGEGVPEALAAALKKGFDCTLECFGAEVPIGVCYLVLILAIALLLAVYIGIQVFRGRRKRREMRRNAGNL